jgi:Group II intron, maturase-specific domain
MTQHHDLRILRRLAAAPQRQPAKDPDHDQIQEAKTHRPRSCPNPIIRTNRRSLPPCPVLKRFGFYFDGPQVKIRVAAKAISRLKSQLRILTGRSWRVSMEFRIGKLNRFITGWVGYFRLADRVNVFRDLDGWLRRRLRQVRWKEWKSTAAKRHNLRIRGMSERTARKWAGGSKGCWRVAGSQVLQVAQQ